MINTELSPIEAASHQQFEHYGSTLVTNYWLRLVCLSLAIAVVMLGYGLVRTAQTATNRPPVIVRIDEIGRAEAVNLSAQSREPQVAEMRYFLKWFVINHYSRDHRTFRMNYQESIYFLDGKLYTDIEAKERQTKENAKFLAGTDEDDTVVQVAQVAIDPSAKPLYRARVDFIKKPVSNPTAPTELWTASILFSMNPDEAAARSDLREHNPLGFRIISLTADQAMVRPNAKGGE